MAVKIRLSRLGKKNRPYYRLGAYDVRMARDGKTLEYLGQYDPHAEGAKQCTFKEDRIRFWVANGAKLTPTVCQLLKKRGVTIKSGK